MKIINLKQQWWLINPEAQLAFAHGGGGTDWILATGFWNDAGFWRDDDVWID